MQITINGYTFDGDNENNVLSGTVEADGSLVLKLYYKVAEFTITYPEAGPDEDGDGEPDVVTPTEETIPVPYGTKILVDPNGGIWRESTEKQTITVTGDLNLKPDPTREGYVFAGWKRTDGTDGIKYVFTAQWAEDTNNNGIPDSEEFVVIYDLKGGTTTSPKTRFEGLRVGDETPTINDPQKDGFDFAGWDPEVAPTIVDPATTQAVTFDGDTKLTIITYTAMWTPQYGNLTIVKTFGANSALNMAPGTATFTVTGAGETRVILYSQFTNGRYTLNDLPVGTYTVTESGANVVGFELVSSSTTATVTADETATLTVTNTYTRTGGEIPDSTSSTTPTQNLPSDSLDPESTSSEPSTTNENPTEVIDDGDVPMADYEDLGEEIEDLDVPLAVWGLNDVDHYAYIIGYDDQTVRPNNQITRAEVATIFFRLLTDEVREENMTSENSFSDVSEGQWFNKAVSTMAAMGVLTGYPDGTFRPNQAITRAEFASIAARFDLNPADGTATFSDTIGHWAEAEISKAVRNGWVNGYPDGTFLPDQPITRAEAMALINRMLERNPAYPEDLCEDMNRWIDNSDETKWYYLDVQEATNSHTYVRLADGTEIWIDKMPDRDWAELER